MKILVPAALVAIFAGVLSAQAVSPPYVETFSAPLGPEWTLSSTGTNGRIRLFQSGSVSPGSGGDGLAMDSSVNQSYVTNRAALAVDLTGYTSLLLSYNFKETSDENDPEDGVFLTDGAMTVQLTNHQGGPSAWTLFQADVAAAAVSAGMNLAALEIVFSQRDNFGIPTDGALFDDIALIEPSTGQANSTVASLDINEGTNLLGQSASIGANGPFFAQGNMITATLSGQANTPYLIAFGPLNVNNVVDPMVGSVDIGATPSLLDVSVIVNGIAPLSFFDQLALLDNSGSSTVAFGVGSLPPGILGGIQAAMQTPSGLRLTAAFEFTVTP